MKQLCNLENVQYCFHPLSVLMKPRQWWFEEGVTCSATILSLMQCPISGFTTSAYTSATLNYFVVMYFERRG